MTFQALLFCEDEKTARLTTQVLNDLEFSVDACNEPFAAVKKLMGQHFDAIVVDCSNEQNAALLFKSARNSSSNQASLAVAVVEGQSGVANAFRIGANLVLTKPINVEQAKGTLRVARGLLKKSGESAKPSQAPVVSSGAAQSAPAPAPSVPEIPKTIAPPPVMAKPVSAPVQPTAVASAARKASADSADLFEVNASSSAASDEISLDSLDEPAVPNKKQGNITDKQRVWPSAVAAPAPAAPAPAKATPSFSDVNPGFARGSLSGGAASAPAPAKEQPKAKPATVETPVREEKRAEIALPGLTAPLPRSTPDRQATPSFAQLSDSDATEKSSGLKAGVLVVLAGVLVAGGYLGYSKLHRPAPPAESTAPQTETPSATVNAQPMGAASQSQSSEQPKVTHETSVQVTAPSSSASKASKPDAGKVAESEPEVVVRQVEQQPTIVKSSPKAVKHQEEVEAPEMIGAAGPDQTAISSIVSSGARSLPVAASAPQTLKVSQGVTQGLLLKRVQPVYPPQALQMRLGGTVQLQASISKTGSITAVKVLSGDPILAHAALDAVKQWKYKPYMLDGEPVAIETQVTVNFKLP